jgi:hypothetical protein
VKSKSIARWGLIAAVGLVGCTAGVPAIVKEPASSSKEAATADAVPPAALGNLLMRIQWPSRGITTQAIPAGADSIAIAVYTKAGQLLDSKTVTRPAGDAPVSNIRFQIAPSHGLVDIEVIVRGGSAILAQGGKKDVPVRDNTATGVSITLDTEGSVAVRLDHQLVLLKNMYHYFDRFQNWQQARSFPEVAAMEASGRAVIDAFNLHGQRLFREVRIGSNPQASRGVPGAREIWHLPHEPALGFEFRDLEILRAFWPGYQVAQTFTSGATTRRLGLALSPDSPQGDQTNANLEVEVSAPWVVEPQLQGTFAGSPSSGASPALRAWSLFGGERPVFEGLTDLQGRAQVDPNGREDRRFKGAFKLSGIQEAGTSPLMAALRHANPYAYYAWTRIPTQAEGSFSMPSLQAAMTASLDSDFQTGRVKLSLTPKDGQGTSSTFTIAADVSVRLRQEAEKTLFDGGTLNFQIDDEMEDLRLKGKVTMATQPQQLLIHAEFIDIPTLTVIGTIDYEAPFDERGGLIQSKNETWPTLVLLDGEGGTPGTRIHLTPGLFSGKTTGGLSVYLY